MINNIKKLLKFICEDYLDLNDKLVEIGYLTYLAQEGKLNQNKENKLRQYISEATDEILKGISRWLFNHGLVSMAVDIGGNYEDHKFNVEGIYSESDLEGLKEKINRALLEDWYKELTKELNNYLANPTYFGKITEEEVEEALKPYIEEEEDYDYEPDEDEDEEPRTYKYFNGDTDDIIDIIIELTGKQVHNDRALINMAENFVDSIEEVKKGIDIYDINKLVMAFDHLKDLNHYNGNMLADYNDVEWDNVNTRIEDRVKGLVKV